ncbi:MAG: hypothetical protein SXQ77_08595 [Halobacteria archaeon]|nr:hypothetical protein [Halobacteria archaeon]
MYPEYRLQGTEEPVISDGTVQYHYKIERYPRSLETEPPDSDPVYKYKFHKWELNGAPMPDDVELILDIPEK